MDDNAYIIINSDDKPQDFNTFINDPLNPKRKIIFIAVAGFLVVGLVLLVLQLIINSGKPSEPVETEDLDAYYATTVDPGEVEEELPSDLKKYQITHADYVSASSETSLIDWPVEDFIPSAATDEHTAVFATAFSAVSQQGTDFYGSIIAQDVNSVASANSIQLDEVPALNSRALNYHLDHGSVVIIHASGEEPFSSTGKYVLIYAAQPLLGVYYYYSPGALCPDCSYPSAINKLQLFSAMQKVSNFYIITPQGENNE